MSTEVLTDDQAKRNIAANLQRLIEELGWSRRAIAAETGESHTIVSQYVAGKKLPGSGALSRIAEVLGVTTDELLADPPPPPRKKSA